MHDAQTPLPPRYLRTAEAARHLGLSGRTLEKHRCYGTGPLYRKIGGRVVYAVGDLQAWVDRGVKSSTTDPGHDVILPRAAPNGARCDEPPVVLGRVGAAALCRPSPRPLVVAEASPTSVDQLTWVELVFDPGRTERWIRFGQAVDQRILSRRNRFVAFRPGVVFAFVRWASNDHGTVVSRLDILQAADATRARIAIPGVLPGAVSLLRLNGWSRVRRALEVIDAVERGGFEPGAVAPDYWRHVHARLAVSLAPLPYTTERHRAFRLRQQVSS